MPFVMEIVNFDFVCVLKGLWISSWSWSRPETRYIRIKHSQFHSVIGFCGLIPLCACVFVCSYSGRCVARESAYFTRQDLSFCLPYSPLAARPCWLHDLGKAERGTFFVSYINCLFGWLCLRWTFHLLPSAVTENLIKWPGHLSVPDLGRAGQLPDRISKSLVGARPHKKQRVATSKRTNVLSSTVLLRRISSKIFVQHVVNREQDGDRDFQHDKTVSTTVFSGPSQSPVYLKSDL